LLDVAGSTPLARSREREEAPPLRAEFPTWPQLHRAGRASQPHDPGVEAPL